MVDKLTVCQKVLQEACFHKITPVGATYILNFYSIYSHFTVTSTEGLQQHVLQL